jgi:hypothetical protein
MGQPKAPPPGITDGAAACVTSDTKFLYIKKGILVMFAEASKRL